jgi:hypothetical protein
MKVWMQLRNDLAVILGLLRFSHFNCAYLMDYHWDHLHLLTLVRLPPLSCTTYDSYAYF